MPPETRAGGGTRTGGSLCRGSADVTMPVVEVENSVTTFQVPETAVEVSSFPQTTAPSFPYTTAPQSSLNDPYVGPFLSHSVSREEFNSSRLTNLETSFLLSQKTGMLEAKLERFEGKANFDLWPPICTDVLDTTCFCGFQPAKHMVRALTQDYGKQFISCPLKNEEEKCSFFKWVNSKVKHNF